MTSILETKYTEPLRPYSQDELSQKQQKLYQKLRLGKNFVRHKKCGHFYLVKKNGRKEKEIIEKNSCDVGNCSVCWKFGKTPAHLSDIAYSIVNEYNTVFYENPTYLTYAQVDLENIFYRWLNQDNI